MATHPTAPPSAKPHGNDKPISGWGGARKGAGRPRKDGTRPLKPGVPHLPRPSLTGQLPVHVTWRLRPEVWSERTAELFDVLKEIMYAAERPGFHVMHCGFKRDYIHLIVEAEDRPSLSRGLQGVGVRLARAINFLLGRSGGIVTDRFHSTILRTPKLLREARALF